MRLGLEPRSVDAQALAMLSTGARVGACVKSLGARLTMRHGFQGVVLLSCLYKGPKAHPQASGQMPC